jgi:hypothetical protein
MHSSPRQLTETLERLLCLQIGSTAGRFNEEIQNEPQAIFGRAVSAVDELIKRVKAESKTGTKELI